jgi:restriction endonuclease S subunit
MNWMHLMSCANIFSGSAVVRGANDSRAVMVGDLDGGGVLPYSFTEVGAPPSGNAGSLLVGDVVISLRGNTNNAAAIEPSDLNGPPLFATLDLAVIRLTDPESINPRYIATWLNLPTTQAILAERREGSAAKRLPLAPLKALQVPVPDWQRQSAIVALARDVADERRIASRIAQLRTTLFNACLAQAAMKETAL